MLTERNVVTEHGQEVLDYLNERYDSDETSANVIETAYRRLVVERGESAAQFLDDYPTYTQWLYGHIVAEKAKQAMPSESNIEAELQALKTELASKQGSESEVNGAD